MSAFWPACEAGHHYKRLTRDEAEADIAEAAIWYERRRAGLGSEFVRSVDTCFTMISKIPEMYPIVHRAA